jgi:hypothetical protein
MAIRAYRQKLQVCCRLAFFYMSAEKFLTIRPIEERKVGEVHQDLVVRFSSKIKGLQAKACDPFFFCRLILLLLAGCSLSQIDQ